MAIEVGTAAPDFSLRNQHGETVALPGFRGRKHVVLVFFPYAFTGTCTGELQALGEVLPELVNDEVQLLALSNDPTFALRVFADTERFAFPLLSDFWPHGRVSRAYEVFDEDKGCAVRGTYVIDKEGAVRWSVVNGLPDARDPEEYLKVLAELRSP